MMTSVLTKFRWYVGLLLVAGLSLSASAQSRITFRDTAVTSASLDPVFFQYRIVVADDEGLTELGNNTAVVLDYDGDHAFTLQDSRILTDNYRLSLRGPAGVSSVPIGETDFDGRYYISTEVTPSRACAFSTYAGRYYIYFRDSARQVFIEPLSAYLPSAAEGLYIAYEPDDLKPVAAACGGDTLVPPGGLPGTPQGGPEAGGCFRTQLAIVCDYSLFQKYGSVNNVLHRTINITNLTKTDYKITNGLTDNVDFVIVEHYVVTCDTCNPWVATTDIYKNLDSVRIKGPSLLINTYDLAQHWFANPTFTSGVVGLAYVGATCDSGYRYNAVLDYTATLSNMRNLNSHEIGHNFNCQHDAANSGFIMAPSVNGSSTWSTASVNYIGNFLSGPFSNCLSPCPATTALCDTLGVNGITIMKDSINQTITVKWTGTSGVDYKVRLYRFATATWTPYTTVAAGVDSALFTVPAGLCAAKWKAEIIPVCPVNLSGGSKMVVFNYRGAPGLWIGATSTSWFTPSNWCGAVVPTASTDVLVPAGAPFMPILIGTATVGSFTLQGGSMTVQPGAVLNVQ